MADSQPLRALVKDATLATVQSAPPATVWALTLNEWVAAATIVYVVLQTAYLLWKWRREWLRRSSLS